MNSFQEAQRLGMNAAHDADRSITFGEITAGALEEVDTNNNRARIDDEIRQNLTAAAGVEINTSETQAQKEKRIKRQKLVNFLRSTIDPEKLFPQLCVGVAKRAIDANTAFWAAQQIVNSACTLAVREYVRRKAEQGITAGFDLAKDDTGAWEGYEARDTEGQASGDNRETANLFSRCDTPEAVEGTFLAWYDHISIQLIALAGASVDRTGAPMQCGQFSRWVETPTGLEQVIETFEDRVQAYLTVNNDRAAAIAAANDPWAKYAA